MNIIKAEVLSNIEDWTAPTPFAGERKGCSASDELFRVHDKITNRDSYLEALLKIVDDTALFLEYYNGAIEAGLQEADITGDYLDEFCVKHDLLENVYDGTTDPNTVKQFGSWDWDDCIPFGARLVPMHHYFNVLLVAIKRWPVLTDYWQHLVDAHNFLASSEEPTASKSVFHIFLTGMLKRGGVLKEMGPVAPPSLDLQTGKVYTEALV